MTVYGENPSESSEKASTTNKWVNLQDIRSIYKDKLHFYILSTNKWKSTFNEFIIFNSIKIWNTDKYDKRCTEPL